MSDELHQLTEKRFTQRKRITLLGRIWLTMLSAANVLVLFYRPFANLLGIEAREPIGTRILALLFLLFAAVELNFIIHPGETLRPDPHDELLLFFRARMLKVGYVTAILALTALYFASLFASPYVGLLVPIALTISLLVPALVYRRLDRQADE